MPAGRRSQRARRRAGGPSPPALAPPLVPFGEQRTAAPFVGYSSRSMAASSVAHIARAFALLVGLGVMVWTRQDWHIFRRLRTRAQQVSGAFRSSNFRLLTCLLVLSTAAATSPAPTASPWTVVVHESPSDPNIGAGWSDTGVTNYSTYGFVHGNCAACDQSLGRYGLLHGPITKTHTGLPTHTHLRVSMRLWKLDWWDYYGIQCCSRQQGDNLFVEADGVTVFTTGVGTVVGPRTHFLRVTHAAQQGSRRGA